jgi:hypothetical protein
VAVPAAGPAPQPVVSWVQTEDRNLPSTGERAPLPAQQPSPFVAAESGPLPVLPALPPRRTYDTGGIPVVDPAPRDRLTVTTDALVYAALAELDEQQTTRALAYGGDEAAEAGDAGRRTA